MAAVDFGGASGRPNDRWKRMVRATSLQWWCDVDPEVVRCAVAGLADIDLDLHRYRAAGSRSWCIVDAAGVPVLEAFHALDVCYRSPYLASLYLIESCDQGASWQQVAVAHLSSAKPYRTFLNDLGRTCAQLLRAGLRTATTIQDHRPSWLAAPPTPAHSYPLLRAAIVSLAAWLKARLGGDLYGIALLDRTAESFLRNEVVAVAEWSEIPARHGFIADPFFWPGRPGHMLCEIYSHATGLGRVAAMPVGPAALTDVEDVSLPVSGHLSYPFAWAENGRVYCLPEMAASRRQVLFEILPGQAPVEVCVVAENIGMADPTLMRMGELYWLAYSDMDIDPYNNLCLMHASDLTGPWQAHPGNPVKIDARSSRPGGTPFQVGDKVYRPAQDCSASYGGALVINQVMVCNTEDYAEEAIAVLTPDPVGRFPDGLHTLSFGDGSVLIDGKRVSYHPAILLHKLRRRLMSMIAGGEPNFVSSPGCQTLPDSSGWVDPITGTPSQ